jgi:hypothetical protein
MSRRQVSRAAAIPPATERNGSMQTGQRVGLQDRVGQSADELTSWRRVLNAKSGLLRRFDTAQKNIRQNSTMAQCRIAGDRVKTVY